MISDQVDTSTDEHALMNTAGEPMPGALPTRRIGLWLSRHRVWGLVPLIATGLLASVGEMSVSKGLLMMIAGGVGILAGTLLRIICRTFTVSEKLGQPLEIALITEGPFALTRNPVYLSEVAIALGIAMMSRMPWLVLITVLTSGAVYGPIIDLHEARLRHWHPDAYAAYSRLVPRWFSLRNLFDAETYLKSRRSVPLLAAIRGESLTMLIALVAILAFLAKANLEVFL
jgi:protein-S-isoprenylcysteine O-methyltransferase Ste14